MQFDRPDSCEYKKVMEELCRLGFKRTMSPKSIFLCDASVHEHKLDDIVIEEHWSAWGGIRLVSRCITAQKFLNDLKPLITRPPNNMERIFDSFREAASFASEYCRTNRRTVQLSRQGSSWAVTENSESQEYEFEYQRSYEDLVREREREREEKQRREEKELAIWERHRDELEKRRDEFAEKRDKVLTLARNGSLSYEQLCLVIDNKGMYGFTEPDLVELLEFQRHVRPGQIPSMCPSCHMVDSNCTCGRSWF